MPRAGAAFPVLVYAPGEDCHCICVPPVLHAWQVAAQPELAGGEPFASMLPPGVLLLTCNSTLPCMAASDLAQPFARAPMLPCAR